MKKDKLSFTEDEIFAELEKVTCKNWRSRDLTKKQIQFIHKGKEKGISYVLLSQMWNKVKGWRNATPRELNDLHRSLIRTGVLPQTR